jgi:hypothetical protein
VHSALWTGKSTALTIVSPSPGTHLKQQTSHLLSSPETHSTVYRIATPCCVMSIFFPFNFLRDVGRAMLQLLIEPPAPYANIPMH